MTRPYNSNLRHQLLDAIKQRPMSTRELGELVSSSNSNIVDCLRKIPGVYVLDWLQSKGGRRMAVWAWSETQQKDKPLQKANDD